MPEKPGETNRRISPTRALREILQEKGLDNKYTGDEIRVGFEKRHKFDSERIRVLKRFRREGWIEEGPDWLRLRGADDPDQTPLALMRGRCRNRRGKGRRTFVR